MRIDLHRVPGGVPLTQLGREQFRNAIHTSIPLGVTKLEIPEMGDKVSFEVINYPNQASLRRIKHLKHYSKIEKIIEKTLIKLNPERRRGVMELKAGEFYTFGARKRTLIPNFFNPEPNKILYATLTCSKEDGNRETQPTSPSPSRRMLITA